MQREDTQPVASTSGLPLSMSPSPTSSQLEDADQMLEDYRAWTSSVGAERMLHSKAKARQSADLETFLVTDILLNGSTIPSVMLVPKL
jgi:hypothetical protein